MSLAPLRVVSTLVELSRLKGFFFQICHSALFTEVMMSTPSPKLARRCVAAALLSASSLLLFDSSSVSAQQTTGTPGAPNATTTIDGNYIPNPPPVFGGEIGLDAKDSKPWWPPKIVPPKD